MVELVVTPDEAAERFRSRDQATDLDERLVRERVGAFPYSDQAVQIESGTAAAAELARRISTWRAHGPSPVDREVWAAGGIGWD